MHFAPSSGLERRFRQADSVTYVTTDLDRNDVGVCANITSLPFRDRSFDGILCSHVLEHISDDTAAMEELHRVVAPGGFALVQCPIDQSRQWTHEDPTITSEQGRVGVFSQHDHVRLYGRDIGERLTSAGFFAAVEVNADRWSESGVETDALRDEVLYYCKR